MVALACSVLWCTFVTLLFELVYQNEQIFFRVIWFIQRTNSFKPIFSFVSEINSVVKI